ncbi:hypothetical protein ROZALSC1DRAFT_25758, partial [Rozella allomycis CSF55]
MNVAAGSLFEGLPPRFVGDGSDIDSVDSWVSTFKMVIRLKGIDDDTATQLFGCWLVGEAKAWYLKRLDTEEAKAWKLNDWLECLITRFAIVDRKRQESWEDLVAMKVDASRPLDYMHNCFVNVLSGIPKE